jgi:CheY-like chemotaxis protein
MNNLVVLYIEDNAMLRHMVSEILQYEGYQVLSTDNGLKGVEMALNVQPNLILMDIHLPVLGGIEATQRLRSQPGFEQLPIIALTAGLAVEKCENFLRAGCSDCLFKPFTAEQLVEVVNRFLGSSNVQAQAVQKKSF